jgi:hypothetical protein
MIGSNFLKELEEDIGKQVNNLQVIYPKVNLIEKYPEQLKEKKRGD